MISLSQIVAALSVTYDDAGVAIWLGSRNRGLGGAAPIDVIARDPLDGIERVADLVRAIGDADPNSNGEERPEDTVRRYARALVRTEALVKRMDEGFAGVSPFAVELLRAALNTEGAPY